MRSWLKSGAGLVFGAGVLWTLTAMRSSRAPQSNGDENDVIATKQAFNRVARILLKCVRNQDLPKSLVLTQAADRFTMLHSTTHNIDVRCLGLDGVGRVALRIKYTLGHGANVVETFYPENYGKQDRRKGAQESMWDAVGEFTVAMIRSLRVGLYFEEDE